MNVADRLSFFAALYKVNEHPKTGMWFLYLTIVVLSIVVYKLGFAKKLPIGKSIVIYIFLILGCTIMTFFGVFLPVAEGLFIAALILIIYKVRLRQAKKQQAKSDIGGREY
ncbi:MAG: YlaH-like family protein [Bacillota bacterium]|nr:YlaH-like family protein [Bacillota bacterium]